MTTAGENLEDVLLIERERWPDGPPHELFERMRNECPVHWTSRVPEFPESAGFWSITTADDVYTVSRDWQTYSSERGGIVAVTANFPLELMRAMFIGMDPPKHDRIKALFQAGFTPKRIAAHEAEIRRIVIADPTLEECKRMGLLVIGYLLVTAVLLGWAKRRIWSSVH